MVRLEAYPGEVHPDPPLIVVEGRLSAWLYGKINLVDGLVYQTPIFVVLFIPFCFFENIRIET